jgi:hypothetical protein
MIPVFERSKIVHALDHAVTGNGKKKKKCISNIPDEKYCLVPDCHGRGRSASPIFLVRSIAWFPACHGREEVHLQYSW